MWAGGLRQARTSSHKRRAAPRSKWMNGMNSRRGENLLPDAWLEVRTMTKVTSAYLKVHTALASVSEMGPRLSTCCPPLTEARGGPEPEQAGLTSSGPCPDGHSHTHLAQISQFLHDIETAPHEASSPHSAGGGSQTPEALKCGWKIPPSSLPGEFPNRHGLCSHAA